MEYASYLLTCTLGYQFSHTAYTLHYEYNKLCGYVAATICPRPCVPNLKIVAFSVCEIFRGPKISELGHVPQATPT